jgi:hypothetical protein
MIIEGTYLRHDVRGVVADGCTICKEMRRFTIIDSYLVPHFWFIPIGGGRLQQSIRRCLVCSNEFRCSPESYQRLLPEAAAARLSDEELRQATAPASPSKEVAPDTGFLDGGGNVAIRSAEFVQVLLKTAPNGAGCLSAIVRLLLIAAIWSTLTGLAFLLFGEPGLGVLALIAMIGGIPGAIYLCESCARAAYRDWFVNSVIERAITEKIDLSIVLASLKAIKPDPYQPDKIRALLGKLKLFEQLLREREMLPSEKRS